MQRMKRGAILALASWLAAVPGTQSLSAQTAGSPSSEEPDKAKAYYHYSLAHMYYERGAMSEREDLLARAIQEMELALHHDPGSSTLSTELADLYTVTGRWQSAIQQLQENVRRNPDDPDARRLLGRLYVRLLAVQRGSVPGNLRQRAIEEFEQIVQRDPNDVSSYLILAQLYRAGDERIKAEETLKKALALQPESGEASTQLALLYVDLGDFRSAIDLLERAVAQDDSPELLGTLGYAYEQVRDFEAAAEAYSRALQRDPENPAYRKGLGQSLLSNRQYDQAREQFESAVRTNPNDAEAFVRLSQIHRMQRNYGLAAEALDKAAELAPDNLEIRYNQIVLEEIQGNLGRAILLIEQVLEQTARAEPNQYTGQERTNRGIFLEKLGALQRDEGDFLAAGNTFRRMLELGGDNEVRGRMRLIETYQEAREYDKALQESAEAVRLFPEERDLITSRASLLAAMGDSAGAVSLLQPLLRNDAEDRRLWIAMAQIHMRAKEFDKALEAAERAAEFSQSPEENAYLYFLNGSIWERQKRFDRAEEQFRRALELNPDSAMTLNYLGYMFADQGVRLDEAVELIQRALESDPNSGAYLDSLGWAYYRQERLDLAEEYLTKAVERIPNDPTIRDHLGDLYFKTGRVAEAVAEWQAALDEWKRLPQNEVEPEEVSNVERKLREAGAL